ncbi:hypothetical protein GCM10009599_23470 [Luteococcus peritonei]
MRHHECYLGTHLVRMRSGASTTAEVSYQRTGTKPTYTIAASQPAHPGAGFYRPWGAVLVKGRISVLTSTRITLWRLDANKRNPTKVNSTMSDAKGNYAFLTTFPAANDSYFFVDSGRGASAQISPLLRILAATPRATASAPAQFHATDNTTITGQHSPAGARYTKVQVLRSGVWTDQPGRWYSTSTGSYSLPFTWERGYVGTYRARVAIAQPNATWLYSPAVSIRRYANLRAVVRATTAADVAKTYRAGCPVGPASLRTIEMNYVGYDRRLLRGVMIVRTDLADNVVRAFTTGTQVHNFPIKSMRNPNDWGGDDVKMMAAGNTSAFNCRRVTGNPYAMSPHSYGKAIDVNTIENPYRDPNGRWYPSATYASYRPASVRGLLVATSGLTVGLKAQGYAWFTGWDWQHFEA